MKAYHIHPVLLQDICNTITNIICVLLSGNTSSNFLAIDFEKNPLVGEADYGLSISLESVEAVYHEVCLQQFLLYVHLKIGKE